MTITITPHIEPDTAAALNALQAQIAALPAPTPPFDPTTLQNEITALDGRVTKLENAATTPPPVNRPPVWTTIPTITFTQGKAGVFSIASFASDPDGNPLTITKNSVALQPGVTFDSAGKQFVYDGIGASAVTTGHVLIADDGKP